MTAPALSVPVDVAVPDSHLDLLTRPVVGVLTTMLPDGQPQSSLVWVDYDGTCARVNTTLELRDGESFAIAGLMQQDTKISVSQLPVLGSLPIIGALFRSTRYQKGETELLIVVTPHLVAPIKPSQVRLPTDRVVEVGSQITV